MHQKIASLEQDEGRSKELFWIKNGGKIVVDVISKALETKKIVFFKILSFFYFLHIYIGLKMNSKLIQVSKANLCKLESTYKLISNECLNIQCS